jgi:hypothetical protein
MTALEWVIGPGPRPHNNSRLTRTLYAPDNPNQQTEVRRHPVSRRIGKE